MNTQIVINAWGGDQRTFDMLMPYWEAHQLPILVTHPYNSAVKTRYPTFVSGPREQGGIGAHTRWVSEIQYLWTQPYDAWAIFEYHSLLLQRDVPILSGLRGIIADNIQGKAFMCDRYVIPPWTFNRESLGKIIQAMKDHPEIYEGGNDDRLLCAWAQTGGVPVLDHEHPFHAPGGGSTILPTQYQALRESVKAGAVFIHGIKSKETLDVIKAAMRK